MPVGCDSCDVLSLAAELNAQCLSLLVLPRVRPKLRGIWHYLAPILHHRLVHQHDLMLRTVQVGLYPGLDAAGDDLVGPGPELEQAPHVKSFFLPEPDGWKQRQVNWIRPSHLDAEHQRRCSPECGIWSDITILNCALIAFWRVWGYVEVTVQA